MPENETVPSSPELPPEPAAVARTRVRHAYQQDMGPRARSALLSWLSFTATFASVRAITHAIRAGVGPFKNMSFGGEHLHHYMWGIGMLAGVGGVAIHGPQHHRRHPATALSYGAGLAPIIDEFALLLDLQDVYCAKQGRVSMDIGVETAALGGTALAATPILRRLLRRPSPGSNPIVSEPRPGASFPQPSRPRAGAQAPGVPPSPAVGRCQRRRTRYLKLAAPTTSHTITPRQRSGAQARGRVGPGCPAGAAGQR